MDLSRVRTNIIYFELVDDRITPDGFVAGLAEAGVKLIKVGAASFRAVTHYGVESDDIDHTLTAMSGILGAQ